MGAENPLPAAATAQGAQQPRDFQVDLGHIASTYSNFARVTYLPEELILDFGINTQLVPTATGEPVKLTHRIVLNFYTAKPLLGMLAQVIQAHENTYGVLEIDVQKRMRAPARLAGNPAAPQG